VFWSQGCQVASQKLLRGGHLQLELRQGDHSLRAMGWRWQGEPNLPQQVDVAYRLALNSWQGEERLQLELVGLRPSAGGASGSNEVVLKRRDRTYWCRREGSGVVVRNAAGEELTSAEASSHAHPYVRALMQDAAIALGLVA
jgi:single-stranded-DNA-specific exonuclease